MRREGRRKNIRTNHTVKYCWQCVEGAHPDKRRKGRFQCKNSHGRCKICSENPTRKASAKIKGKRKEARRDMFGDVRGL